MMEKKFCFISQKSISLCLFICLSVYLSVCLSVCLSFSLCMSGYGVNEWADWEPSWKWFGQWLVGICWRCSRTVCVQDSWHWAVGMQSSLCCRRKEIHRIWRTGGWSLCCGETIRSSLKLWLPKRWSERWWVRSSMLTAPTVCLAGW